MKKHFLMLATVCLCIVAGCGANTDKDVENNNTQVTITESPVSNPEDVKPDTSTNEAEPVDPTEEPSNNTEDIPDNTVVQVDPTEVPEEVETPTEPSETFEFEFEGRYWYCADLNRVFYFNGKTVSSNFGEGGRPYHCKEIDGKYEINTYKPFTTLTVDGTNLTWTDETGEYSFTETDENKYKELLTSFVGKYWLIDHFGDGTYVVAYHFDEAGNMIMLANGMKMEYQYTIDMENIYVSYDDRIMFYGFRTDEGLFRTKDDFGTVTTYTEISKEDFEAMYQ